MENYNDILDMFPSKEMKEKLNEVIIAIDELSQKTPVVGFHHSFYVPGWIGYIQQMFVESKMNKFASQKFCRNINYYEFADWIVDKSKEITELQTQTTADDQTVTQTQSEAVARVFNVLSALWMNCCPEISTYCNIKYGEDRLISPAGMVYKGIEENLKKIGIEENEKGNNSGPGFKESAKNMFYMFAGYIINIIIFASIIGIIGAIFG